MDIRNLYYELEIVKENENNRLVLVRNRIDRLLYLKREIPSYNKQVYHQLAKAHIRYTPEIFHVQEIDNKIVVIEEYINSSTLEEYILNNKINKQEALKIFKQLCNIVKQLHDLTPPLIHRDIKPSNIFYDGSKVYLFDFDISRNYQNNQSKDTYILGSVGYAAPEQFGFSQTSQQSDIYALGVLLNFILTKKLPNERLYDGYESKVIHKAINIDPKQRYENVSMMLKELNLEDNDDKLRYYLINIPGFRNNSLIKKILAFAGYTLIFSLCMVSEMTIDNVLLTGLDLWINRILVFFIIMTTILFAGNYLEIWEQCFFAKSKLKIIRIMGIIVTAIACVFLMIFVIGGINNILSMSAISRPINFLIKL